MSKFLNIEKPLLTCMVQGDNLQRVKNLAMNARVNGADAFGLQLCKIPFEDRTVEKLKETFYVMGNKPIYVTNYRGYKNEGLSDDDLPKDLFTAIDAGATLIDVIGNLYDKSDFEMTYNEKAIDKQKRLIEEIHKKGCEVLISTHTKEFLTEEQVLELAFAQKSHGADIVKIVTRSDTEEQLLANLKTTIALKNELKSPFLFLSSGEYCKVHRAIGPALGCCMYLCVDEYDEYSTAGQVPLKIMRGFTDALL